MPSNEHSSNIDDETMGSENSVSEPVTKKKDTLTIINTNARSLIPKIDSLDECFGELEADIAVVTETWMRDGL